MRFALFSCAIAALSIQQAATLPLHERSYIENDEI
jgi:hypothetical protein